MVVPPRAAPGPARLGAAQQQQQHQQQQHQGQDPAAAVQQRQQQQEAAPRPPEHPDPDSRCGSVPGLTLTSFHLEQLRRLGQEVEAEAAGGDACADAPCLRPGPRSSSFSWLRRHWLVQELDASTVEAIAAFEAEGGTGLTGVCPRANAATREGVAAARGALLAARRAVPGHAPPPPPPEMRAWGVRSLALLRHAVEVGADGATVNWPHVARRELAGGARRPEG